MRIPISIWNSSAQAKLRSLLAKRPMPLRFRHRWVVFLIWKLTMGKNIKMKFLPIVSFQIKKTTQRCRNLSGIGRFAKSERNFAWAEEFQMLIGMRIKESAEFRKKLSRLGMNLCGDCKN